MFTNSERKTNEIPYKFIVVCDKFTEPIAHSISNRAVDKGVESVVWNEKDYNQNRVQLKNFNHVLFLNEKNLKTNLADPTIKSQQIVSGVFYKKQGHQAGVFVDKNSNPLKMADYLAGTLKEDWGFVVVSFVNAHVGLLSSIGWSIWRQFKSKKAKFYLLMKAIDKFDKDFLLDYVQDK